MRELIAAVTCLPRGEIPDICVQSPSNMDNSYYTAIVAHTLFGLHIWIENGWVKMQNSSQNTQMMKKLKFVSYNLPKIFVVLISVVLQTNNNFRFNKLLILGI